MNKNIQGNFQICISVPLSVVTFVGDLLLDDAFFVFTMVTQFNKCNFYNATKYRYTDIIA